MLGIFFVLFYFGGGVVPNLLYITFPCLEITVVTLINLAPELSFKILMWFQKYVISRNRLTVDQCLPLLDLGSSSLTSQDHHSGILNLMVTDDLWP